MILQNFLENEFCPSLLFLLFFANIIGVDYHVLASFELVVVIIDANLIKQHIPTFLCSYLSIYLYDISALYIQLTTQDEHIMYYVISEIKFKIFNDLYFHLPDIVDLLLNCNLIFV